MPIYWNIHDEVNRWGGPWEAALLIPALATVIYLFILALDWGWLDFKAARGTPISCDSLKNNDIRQLVSI